MHKLTTPRKGGTAAELNAAFAKQRGSVSYTRYYQLGAYIVKESSRVDCPHTSYVVSRADTGVVVLRSVTQPTEADALYGDARTRGKARTVDIDPLAHIAAPLHKKPEKRVYHYYKASGAVNQRKVSGERGRTNGLRARKAVAA